MGKVIWKSTGEIKDGGSEQGESLWVRKEYRKESVDVNTESGEPKNQNLSVDVAVIGAGLVGILTAYKLMMAGKKVVVLERSEVGDGATKNTSAKITSQHDLIYDKLIKAKGKERAKEYAMANERAIFQYKEVIDNLDIDCGYEVLPSYIYTLDNEDKIRKEAEAARELGISAQFTKDVNLPFDVKAAVKFARQAQFNPLRFLDRLSKEVTVYNNEEITEIKDNGMITTRRGKIKAESVVIASHYPFINRTGYYFLKLHQERFYVNALKGWHKGENDSLGGMYLDGDPNGFSFRSYEGLLLLGTGGHRTGQTNPIDAYKKLEEARDNWYPSASIECAWSNQDCMTPDGVPYIGKYSSKLPRFYVATGFNKWGMTSSMAAATILRDAICKMDSPYKKVFYPQRLMLSGTKKMLQDTSIITVNLLSEKLKISSGQLDSIEQGGAGIIKQDGRKLGVYRDKEDQYYYVTTKCPHLGCSLAWNQNELTWDCPCHGSRFDYEGRLINNPATRDVFDSVCKRRS